MTEEDKAWLAEFDGCAAGWSEHMRIYVTVLRLRRLLREAMEEHDHRVSELLEANNREVEHRREASRIMRQLLRNFNAAECQECGIGRTDEWKAAEAYVSGQL